MPRARHRAAVFAPNPALLNAKKVPANAGLYLTKYTALTANPAVLTTATMTTASGSRCAHDKEGLSCSSLCVQADKLADSTRNGMVVLTGRCNHEDVIKGITGIKIVCGRKAEEHEIQNASHDGCCFRTAIRSESRDSCHFLRHVPALTKRTWSTSNVHAACSN